MAGWSAAQAAVDFAGRAEEGVTKKQVAERLHEVFMDSLVDVADCKLLWE